MQFLRAFALGGSCLVVAAVAACSAGSGGSKFENTGGKRRRGQRCPSVDWAVGPGGGIGLGGGVGTGSTGTGIMPMCTAMCQDFPTAPEFDDGAPMTAPGAFQGTPTGMGPCILEPQEGSLFPHNWLRPRIKVQSSATLFQITFHCAIEANDYVVYTTKPTWAMPKAVWTKLANNALETDIDVTVRASNGSSFSESKTTFRILRLLAGRRGRLQPTSRRAWRAPNTGAGKDDLVWVDLAAAGSVPMGMNLSSAMIGTALVMLQHTAWDIIPRTGDTRAAVTPNWSHDGTRIAYTSADSTTVRGAVQWRKGWPGRAVAHDVGVGEYYPDFSPDDKFIAYNRVAQINANIPNNSPPALYYRPDAEIYMRPSDGTGIPLR
jgi:hypothetical protein